MKLYTEEDVLHMLRSFHNLEMNVQLCMLKLTPIELPSDEEIGKEFTLEAGGNKWRYGHKIEGAIWMRDKIGGNK